MRSTDLVRQVLDLLDSIDSASNNDSEPTATCGTEQGEPIASRFKQIMAMINSSSTGPYSNTPNEIVADVDAVTTDAGGGLNGPKDPADIRVKDPRGFE